MRRPMATSEDETTQLDDEPLDIETPGDGEVADAASRLDASVVSCPFPFHRLSVPLWGQRAALYPCAADAIPCSLVRSLAESPAGAAAVLLVSWLVYIALWVPFALTQFAFTEAGAWLLLFTALQRVCAVATRFIAYPASFVSVRAQARARARARAVALCHSPMRVGTRALAHRRLSQVQRDLEREFARRCDGGCDR